MTKEQALAIDMAPGINDTADAEIFFWQLTGREWNGSRSSYHMEATQKWRRLRKSEEAAASARDANAAQHADARVLQKMAEEIDNDFGVRIVQMVAVLLTNTTKHMPHMISKDLQEGGAEFRGTLCHTRLRAAGATCRQRCRDQVGANWTFGHARAAHALRTGRQSRSAGLEYRLGCTCPRVSDTYHVSSACAPCD